MDSNKYIDKERYIKNVKNMIDVAERMKKEMPPHLLSAFTDEMWLEHDGYVKGLKTALDILHVISEE